ncbi:L-lactate permease [Paraburkholderia rhizosphaerae]|uniref:L-lactate permease n=1 Tax=Paraburkholderia rhizosphaerae TaxID=480658 RepID=A0A4R8L6D1_9BURK|nr:L-lactate permease [Paraburkholderia rhizosphaerae]TDY38217.1 lactate permease [Paraburkholderia rhizosphaerae]
MGETTIPIDLLHWILATLSIIALLVFLVPLKWRAPEAGPGAMFVAGLIALFAFRTPITTLTVASAKGVWDAIFILYVMWPALFLYQITKQAGGYDALRHGISRFSRNELFVILGLGWVFSSFLQGIAGFGAPIAVVAPLLLAIGVRPVYAATISIIAHAWARFFGTLGVGWLATLQVADIQDVTRAAFESSLLLLIPTYFGGLLIVWLYGRWAAVRHAWPLVLILGTILGFGQLIFAFLSPELSTFLAATVAMIALYPLSRWRRFSEPVPAADVPDRPAMDETAVRAQEETGEPVMSIGMAFLPYVVLTIVTLGILLIDPLNNTLRQFRIGLPFPEVTTGFGVTNAAVARYAPFSPLTHPGTMLLIAAIIVWIVYRANGYYGAWQSRHGKESLGRSLIVDGVPASLPVIAFLVTSRILDHSGQTMVLAHGIADASPPLVYAGIASVIGALGAFMTSSSTASNVLFGGLQSDVAQLHSLPIEAIIAAQAAGSAYGNAIGPANIVLGTSITGIKGQEGAVMKLAIPWTIIVAVLTGIGTIALVILA